MNKIKKLPEHIIKRVAAGEVIENPAAVVKELVENAIDAKATKITIEVEDSGLTKIRVIDNGEGMSKEDLSICHLRHTTSKLEEENLENIKTLGFRGEALYTINAVSNCVIKSKQENSLEGYVVDLSESPLQIKPVGMPDGTEITVAGLFHNLPGRKEYLSNKNLEYKKIITTVIQQAIARPHIGFTFNSNKNRILVLPQNQSLKERLNYIFDEDLAKGLMEIDVEKEHIRIKGYISKPQHTYPNKDNQYLFVNKRSVDNKEILNIIKNAYGTLLEPRNYPAYVLNIEMEETLVDVNIHPRKQQVKFLNVDTIHRLIEETTREVLNTKNLSYATSSNNDTDIMEFEEFLKNKDKGDFFAAQVLRETTDLWNYKTNDNYSKEREIIQLHKVYLLLESESGIIIYDQHAAHERILYEDFLEQFLNEKQEPSIVETKEIFELPISLVPTLESNFATLNKIGIKVEHFGKNSFRIKSIPKIISNQNIKKLIIEILSDLEEGFKTNGANSMSQKTISYLACRTAIKSGDYLTQQERLNIIEKVEATKTKYTCPHGRPVKIEISKSELAKMFKRIK